MPASAECHLPRLAPALIAVLAAVTACAIVARAGVVPAHDRVVVVVMENKSYNQVRTQQIHGKVRRSGRFVGRRSDWKKAIVTLEPDQKIELFEQI